MRTWNYPYTLLLLLVVCMMTGCGDRARENSFDEIESRISADPKAAVLFVDSLAADSTWSTGMSKAKRARFDLLRVKSADKAYVRHTSDSLIRTVLEYYEKHTGSDQYPEALYYGGRVYSDLGDSPTALRYFHNALDAIENSDKYKRLRVRILGQMASLLNHLHLYNDAIPYLRQVIEMRKEFRDTLMLSNDLQLLGAVYMHKNELDSARKIFEESKDLSTGRSESSVAKANMYLAGIQSRMGNYEEAVSLIRGIPERITDSYHTTALAYAANIYKNLAKHDTALLYANEILNNPDTRNHKVAYGVLLSPEVMELQPKDSLANLYLRFGAELNRLANDTAQSESSFQNSLYNYSLHEREHRITEEKNNRLKNIGIILLIIIIIFIFIISALRNRSQKQRLELYKALEDIRLLKESLRNSLENKKEIHNDNFVSDDLIDSYSKGNGNVNKEDSDDINKLEFKTAKVIDRFQNEESKILRDRLRKEIIDIVSSSKTKRRIEMDYKLPVSVLESASYKKMKFYVANEKTISPENDLWNELNDLVEQIWPNYNKNIDLLFGPDISQSDRRLCLLIKLGMAPRDISHLLGKVKGTISTHRGKLCKEVLGMNKGAQVLDVIIRLI